MADKSCKNDVKGSTLNGSPASTYFLTTRPTGVVRVTNLNLQNASADYAVLCIQTVTSSSCSTPDALFLPHDNTITYAMFESSNHRCCPICVEGIICLLYTSPSPRD